MKTIDCTLFDSTEFRTYDDYVENCTDNGVEPQGENSQHFFDWQALMTQLDADDFFENLKYCPQDGPCMITGSLGLWVGRRGVVPVLCDNIEAAVKKICDGMRGDYQLAVMQRNGYLVVEQSHHDGTNVFEIHLLSAKGRKEVARPCYEYERDFEPKPFWFKKIKGYLY